MARKGLAEGSHETARKDGSNNVSKIVGSADVASAYESSEILIIALGRTYHNLNFNQAMIFESALN